MAWRGVELKDPIREGHLFRRRALVALVGTVFLLVTLLARMAYLQLVQHSHFITLSDNNRVSVVPITPTRGLIYDRNGVLIAQNIPTFSLEIIPEQTDSLQETLAAVASLIEVSESDRQRFAKERRRKRPFEPIPLRFRLTDEEVAIVSVNRHRLRGVEVTAQLSRQYPLAEYTAHSLGYVGRISEAELRKVDSSNYRGTSQIGKLGVEKSQEELLHGQVGYQQVETNARGRVLRTLESTPPIPGSHLILNLDINLQRAAMKAFGNDNGALVAVDPRDGGVLALVSIPSYDSNLFVDGIDPDTYEALLNARGHPLFNRALQGQYPPGSTTKPFVGLAGLEYGVRHAGDKVACHGWYQLENDERRYRDWKKEGHGTVDLNQAIVQSCDVFFYDLAFDLGIDRISEFMTHFGFGKELGIDIGGEASGLMPNREWKRRTRHQPWFPGETLITGIGQGFMLTTPLQLAVGAATLAMNGVGFVPQVVRAVQDPATEAITPAAIKGLPPVAIHEQANWDRIHRAMINVVHNYRGTARGISHNLDYTIAGKTGTAQVFGIKQDEEYVAEEIEKKLRDHALFIGYAPADDPQIAVAVVVENGGSGGAVAAPIARRVMDAFIKGGATHASR